jgi:Domain of unknown function (DUF4398)
MDQAQGAIDTAKAAGADRYAPDEYKAAVAALERSKQMVDQRDYRQALNFALDARERAQDAARAGAGRMAQVRSEVETLLDTAGKRLQIAQTRVKPGAGGRLPDAAVTALRETIGRAEKDLQEARAAVTRQDYLQARDLVQQTDQHLRDAMLAAEQAATKDRRPATRKPAPR